MAIRVRIVDHTCVALCAAKSEPLKDDLYLDDNVHYALFQKFESDFIKMGFMKKR